MAVIQSINGALKIKDTFNIINTNDQALNADIVADALALQNHINDALSAHAAGSISFSSTDPNLTAIEVKTALEQLSTRISSIIASSGTSSTEVVDARLSSVYGAFTTLANRLNASDVILNSHTVQFAETETYIKYPSENILGYGRNWFDIQVPLVTDFIDNVFSVQNKSSNGNIYGNAAIAFLDLAGTERGAIGYSRNKAIQPNGYLANLMYCEIGNPFTTDGEDTDFSVVVSQAAGAMNFPGTTFKAIEVVASTGAINLRARGGKSISATGGNFEIGNIGEVEAFKLGLQNTSVCLREYASTDSAAFLTNVSNPSGSSSAIVKDDSTKPAWKVAFGAGANTTDFDSFEISRSEVGSSIWSDFFKVHNDGKVFINQKLTSPGADGQFSVTCIGGTATTTKNTGNVPTSIIYNANSTGDNMLVDFATETDYTKRGGITFNRTGGVVAYNTTSDYRAKTVKGKLENALERVALLKPCIGRMNGATEDIDFFVAHELQSVIPSAVTGVKDAIDEDGKPIYQMIDKSSIIPLLTASIQELMLEIEKLKLQINTLTTS